MEKPEEMKIQQQVFSDDSDDRLLFLRQMGVRYVYVLFRDEHTDYDSVMRFIERLHKQGLTPTDAGNRSLYKNPAIHLGLPGRDEAIDRYNAFLRVLGRASIPFTYMTWEPNGVLSTAYAVGEHTRGAAARLVDTDRLAELPYSHGRFFGKEEMWENFGYFLDRVLPVCEETGVKIALHPNDPPVPALRGISSLITSAQDYRRAFAMAKDSPYLGMKFCVGCWLEGGPAFGDLLEDIRYFARRDKILTVHFRNVSSCVPRFEETLLEDGYMDMYRVMRQLVDCGYHGLITTDHVPEYVPSCGGKDAAAAYSLGYLKALLRCAQAN